MRSKGYIKRYIGEYPKKPLQRGTLAKDPTTQFARWYEAVVKRALFEPNAMVLATTDNRGRPSARVVLLKSFSRQGFIFFTNYRSRKGSELRVNPHASLVFYWPELTRQVRICGRVKKISAKESDRYFSSRPRRAKLGAHASVQSSVINGRKGLDHVLEKLEQLFAGKEIPRPKSWGGYLIVPDEFEFWQGRQDRLHDRFRYRRSARGGWAVERLAP